VLGQERSQMLITLYVNMYTCIYASSKFYYLDLEVPLYNFDYVS